MKRVSNGKTTTKHLYFLNKLKTWYNFGRGISEAVNKSVALRLAQRALINLLFHSSLIKKFIYLNLIYMVEYTLKTLLTSRAR